MYDETVINQLENLQPQYREFILSEMPEVIAEGFSMGLNLTEAEQGTFTNAVILFLIFLLDRESFRSFLATECGVPIERTSGLDSAIVAALPPEIKSLFLTSEAELNNLAENSSPDLTAEIQMAEAALSSIPSVRTMAGDGQATPPETTYTSTQAAILTEKYGEVPQSGARWETDN